MKPNFCLVAALCAACAVPARALERLEPKGGCYFGFTLDSGRSVASLSSNLGFTPAVHLRFFSFGGATGSMGEIRIFLAEVTAVQGIAMLTLEPWGGLETITEGQCTDLANLCRYFEDRGIGGIFVRLGHEMNGNWYPWGQRPALFKSRFRQLSQVLRSRTDRTAMVWAPNYGVGYPFGLPVPLPGSADFKELDTDRDGTISDRDDMYEPYYPGSDVVDWVGMTLYHWGIDFPWLENELPPANSFARALVGTYQGSTPNFYQRYCDSPTRAKPMAITETAAFYNTERSGPSELQIKREWWRQVFDGLTQFPMLKCINWFDEYKRESIAENNLIDWRISANPEIRAAFLAGFHSAGSGERRFLTADDLKPLILRLTLQGTVATITWDSRVGHLYRLCSTTDLKSWTETGEWIAGTGQGIAVQIHQGPDSSAVVYRLKTARP